MSNPAYHTDDTFRQYPLRDLTAQERAMIGSVKDVAAEMEQLFDGHPPSREMALARTKLEEAVMWAVKGITAGE